MCQHEWDNQEEEFSNEYTPEEEKHQALADVIMAKIINDYADDSTEVLLILTQALCRMASGELDSITTDSFHSILDIAINAPFDKRHEPFNRFVIDALYAKSLAMAELVL
jgi:hypothetical protein